MRMTIPKILHVIPLLIASAWSSNSVIAAEVKVAARFMDGNGEAASDAFPGAAGHGWLDAWKVLPKNYQDRFSVEVTKENPFPDSPQSLKIQGKGAQSGLTLSRLIDTSILDTAKPYTITFKIRLDSFDAPESQFGFLILGKQEGSADGPSTSLWYLVAQNGRWYVVGKKEDKASWVRSSIPINAGAIYAFTIKVNPEAASYQVKISDGSQEYESPELTSFSPQAAIGGNTISFSGRFSSSERAGLLTWSMADVQIVGSK